MPEGGGGTHALGPGAAGRRELRLVLNASIYSSRETQPLSAIHTWRAGGAQGCGGAGDAVLLCPLPGSLPGSLQPAAGRRPVPPRDRLVSARLERHRKLPGRGLGPISGRGVRAAVRALSAGQRGGRPAVRVRARAPSSRRWAPGEWRVPGRGRGRGRQGPPVGRTGGLSAVGPHGGPGAWTTVSPAPGSRHGRPPLGCSPARGPQLLSLRNVVWVNTRLHSLGSFLWLQGSHTQAVEPPASASVSQFSSPPALPRWPGAGWGGGGHRCG